jgi:hypothetical protein
VFPCQLATFPCRYLGIPLSIYQLKKSGMQPLVDAVVGRLPARMGRLMSKAGRTTLTKVTQSTIPIHVAIVLKLCPGIRHEIDKIRQAFIWTGTDRANGGQCMVAWSRVTRPVELGGLGVLDLETLGYALRLRWSWLARVDPDRISSLLAVGAASNKEDRIIKAMFQASTSVQIGNGARTLFWNDP